MLLGIAAFVFYHINKDKLWKQDTYSSSPNYSSSNYSPDSYSQSSSTPTNISSSPAQVWKPSEHNKEIFDLRVNYYGPEFTAISQEAFNDTPEWAVDFDADMVLPRNASEKDFELILMVKVYPKDKSYDAQRYTDEVFDVYYDHFKKATSAGRLGPSKFKLVVRVTYDSSRVK